MPNWAFRMRVAVRLVSRFGQRSPPEVVAHKIRQPTPINGPRSQNETAPLRYEPERGGLVPSQNSGAATSRRVPPPREEPCAEPPRTGSS